MRSMGMRTRTATLALTIALTVPTIAGADMHRDVYVPKKAAKMSSELAQAATWAKAFAETEDQSQWPLDTTITVWHCKVSSRWKGSCEYKASFFIEPSMKQHACERRVTTRINKRTRRVSSKVANLGCATA